MDEQERTHCVVDLDRMNPERFLEVWRDKIRNHLLGADEASDELQEAIDAANKAEKTLGEAEDTVTHVCGAISRLMEQDDFPDAIYDKLQPLNQQLEEISF